MKFNWGTGIFLFYSIFAASLFFQVYKSTQYDYHLVVENYYEKDLAYQSHYEKIENSQALQTPLQINYSNKQKMIELIFPDGVGAIQGTVLFYRSSDKKMDVQLPIVINDEQKMMIKSDKFSDGYWRVEVDWEADGKAYFDKKQIQLKKA